MDKLISDAQHAIGMGHRKPYKRHGRLFYRPYRNYFCTAPDNPVWCELERLGYAKHGEIHDHRSCQTTNFWLTRLGLDWLGEQIGVVIHDEDD